MSRKNTFLSSAISLPDHSNVISCEKQLEINVQDGFMELRMLFYEIVQLLMATNL